MIEDQYANQNPAANFFNGYYGNAQPGAVAQRTLQPRAGAPTDAFSSILNHTSGYGPPAPAPRTMSSQAVVGGEPPLDGPSTPTGPPGGDGNGNGGNGGGGNGGGGGGGGGTNTGPPDLGGGGTQPPPLPPPPPPPSASSQAWYKYATEAAAKGHTNLQYADWEKAGMPTTFGDYFVDKAIWYNSFDTPYKGTITPDDVRMFHQWSKEAAAAGKPGTRIEAWLGDGRPQHYVPIKAAGTEPPGPQGGTVPPKTMPPPVGGPPVAPSPVGPAPDSNAALEALKETIRRNSDIAMMEQERGLRAKLAFNRADKTGAADSAIATAGMQAEAGLQGQLAQLDYGSHQAELERALKEKLAKLSSDDMRYGVDKQVTIAEIQASAQRYAAQVSANAQMAGVSAQAAASQANAAAARYEADMRYKLGIAGLDVERENNYLDFTNGQNNQLLEWIKNIIGMSPDGVLNGMPWPGGSVIVNP